MLSLFLYFSVSVEDFLTLTQQNSFCLYKITPTATTTTTEEHSIHECDVFPVKNFFLSLSLAHSSSSFPETLNESLAADC
jgi:hypothetical protein